MKVKRAENFITMFEQSIGVEEPWYIDRAGFEDDKQEVHIYIRARETSRYPCPVCNEMCHRYDNEDEERTWRHGDVVFYPCYVHCRRPRIKCDKHGIHVVTAPWAREKSRYTLLFEGYAMLLLADMPVLKVSRILKCSHTALTGILRYWVEKAVAEDNLSEVTNICVDETSHRRGHRYVTIVIDGEKKRVIDVEEGRNAGAIEIFSHKLEAKGGDCNKIQNVVCDMSKAYVSAKEFCFPKAQTIIDKFHVKKLLLDALDKVRREEQGLRKHAGGKGRKLVMIPEGKLTQKQREAVEELSRKYPKTGRAYRMVQTLDYVYSSLDEAKAKERFSQLIRWMRRSRLEPMKHAAATLKTYKDEILAYFRSRLTNAIAEGINSMIQAAKRKARGYKTFRGFSCMIYLVAGKLRLSCTCPI